MQQRKVERVSVQAVYRKGFLEGFVGAEDCIAMLIRRGLCPQEDNCG